MSMSSFSLSGAVDQTQTAAGSALPNSPVVEESLQPGAPQARTALATIVRRFAAAQLRWANRIESVPVESHLTDEAARGSC